MKRYKNYVVKVGGDYWKGHHKYTTVIDRALHMPRDSARYLVVLLGCGAIKRHKIK